MANISSTTRRVFLAEAVSLTLLAVGCKNRSFVCTNASSLSPSDEEARRAVAYVEPAADLSRSCDACQQWTSGDGECGGCKLLRGPIHPKATCKLFALRL